MRKFFATIIVLASTGLASAQVQLPAINPATGQPYGQVYTQQVGEQYTNPATAMPCPAESSYGALPQAYVNEQIPLIQQQPHMGQQQIIR